MSDLKTIAVESSTKSVLAMLKQHPRETYDDVIRRLVEGAARDHVAREREERPEMAAADA